MAGAPGNHHLCQQYSAHVQLSACFSGLVAGILGLTNIPGFLLYLLTALSCAGINAGLKCGFDVPKYVPQAHSASAMAGGQPGKQSRWRGYLALSGIGQEGVLGFLLFWIGGYALIHGTSGSLTEVDQLYTIEEGECIGAVDMKAGAGS